MEMKPLGVVLRDEGLDRIERHFGGRRNLGQELAIRSAEAKRAVRLSIELIALLVDGAMVPATEQGQIRERGGAAVGPVTDVMAVAEPDPAAWEAAAAVAMVERSPDRRGNRPGPGIDLHDPAIPAVAHHHPAGVAGQALGRSSWNACAVLERRLAWRVGVRQDLGIDVDDHLVALPRAPGVEALVEGRLREQGEGVRLLLLHRRWVGFRFLPPPLLVQRLPSGCERLHEQGARPPGSTAP